MKRFCYAVALSAAVFSITPKQAYCRQWRDLRGAHFIVHYQGRESSFAREVLRQAEAEYRRISRYLGYIRYSDFWTWDNRVNIYLYPDHASFIEGTGMPLWSHGMADYAKKEIAGYIDSRQFIDFILGHEIAHLIFRDFVGFEGEVPLWLDEGVAQWVETERRNDIQRTMKARVSQGFIISLERMMDMDIRSAEGLNEALARIGSSDNSGNLSSLGENELVSLFYLESASIVGFLIERYGNANFTRFCRRLRDGDTVEGALRRVYPRAVSTISGLEKAWLEYIAHISPPSVLGGGRDYLCIKEGGY